MPPEPTGLDQQPAPAGGIKRQVFAAREVILAGGAFNTPQLLMLSGIGPTAALDEVGIPVRVPLDGVGTNLQDRYEVAVVNRMNFPAWKVLEGATYTNQDEQYRDWADHRRGVYASNGAILSVIARSHPGAPSPDLFLYALLGLFNGYKPGYSSLLRANSERADLGRPQGAYEQYGWRGHPSQCRPAAMPPRIHFKYFEEGNDAGGADARAVAQGVRLARRLAAKLVENKLIAAEEVPGPSFPDDRLEDFVRERAWGHHASCTCRIGNPDDGGVLSTDFKRIHGVTGLRVVDASIFPRIPGFFIASAIYMVGEKAADVIASDAHASAPLGQVSPFGR